MAITCLSRTLDESDYPLLERELRYVDLRGIAGQHPARRWEYALALHAVGRWLATGRALNDTLYVVPPSSFRQVLGDWTERDPVAITSDALPAFCSGGTPLADVVTALGVLECVPDPEAILYAASCLLAPGGLLVLTFAYWNRCGEDTAVNHDRRKRIYCPKLLTVLRAQAQACLLTPFGGVDPTWHGCQVHDYTIASLVLEKRR